MTEPYVKNENAWLTYEKNMCCGYRQYILHISLCIRIYIKTSKTYFKI